MQQEGTHAVHEGRNVKRIREILGIKQDALGYGFGDFPAGYFCAGAKGSPGQGDAGEGGEGVEGEPGGD